jgi:hypothetical protein
MVVLRLTCIDYEQRVSEHMASSMTVAFHARHDLLCGSVIVVQVTS